MNSAGRMSLDEMGRVDSGSIDIRDMVEAARNAIAGKSTIEALAALANIHGIVPVKRRREGAAETLTKFPLHSLFSSIHMSSDGRVVAKTPGFSTSERDSD